VERSSPFASSGKANAGPRRRPKGYLGRQHETIGSDILSVYRMLKLPEQVLGTEEARVISELDPDGWYPIEWFLDLMDRVDQALGHYGLLRMGRTLFDLSHKERVLRVAKSARDIVYGIDGMYHHANRGGGIGGWKVLRFEPGYAELEKTTPHHCVMEQGILAAALAGVGCPGQVSQNDCFRRGADCCLYTITSSLTDERWSGTAAGR
jgi:hypothetical protein